MDIDLAQKSVSAALSGDWKEAEKINKQILTENPGDVDALNRLARACAELGELSQARATAKKVLKLDPFNSIAAKCLAKWQALKKGDNISSGSSNPEAFLEEPGKTKIVSLLHLGDPQTISKLNAGDIVILSPSSHRVNVETQAKKYIGRLSDDLAARLRNFIKMGNEYQTLIKSCEPKDVKIFIRETKKAESLANVPSFSAEKIDYVSFTPPELVHKKEDGEVIVNDGEVTADVMDAEV